MRVRASVDLSELDDEALFESLSEGLGHILNNSRRLYESCESLEKTRRFQAALILRNVAEEEASKFLILIDAIRCPRDPVDRWRRQIKRFNDHLAKGLYVASCFWRHAAFGQLQGLLRFASTGVLPGWS